MENQVNQLQKWIRKLLLKEFNNTMETVFMFLQNKLLKLNVTLKKLHFQLYSYKLSTGLKNRSFKPPTKTHIR